MSSPIDLCNSALAEIGTQSQINSFTEASAEAFNCQLFYDPMRRSLLRQAPWGFARKQVALSLLDQASNYTTSTPPFYPFLYSYAYPADCMKLRYLTYQLPVNSTDVAPVTGIVNVPVYATRRFRFLVSTTQDNFGNNTKVILCNVPNAIGVYNYDVQNVDMFDPQFRETLINVLAYKLVIPLSGNISMKLQWKQLAEETCLQARASDGQEALPTTDHTPDWIKTRGFPMDGWMGPGNGGQFGDMGGGVGYWGEGWDSLGWGS